MARLELRTKKARRKQECFKQKYDGPARTIHTEEGKEKETFIYKQLPEPEIFHLVLHEEGGIGTFGVPFLSCRSYCGEGSGRRERNHT